MLILQKFLPISKNDGMEPHFDIAEQTKIEGREGASLDFMTFLSYTKINQRNLLNGNK